MNPIKKLIKFLTSITSILLVYFISVACSFSQSICEDPKVIELFKKPKIGNQMMEQFASQALHGQNKILEYKLKRFALQLGLINPADIGGIIGKIAGFLREQERIKRIIKKQEENIKKTKNETKKIQEEEKLKQIKQQFKISLTNIKQIEQRNKSYICSAKISTFKEPSLPIRYIVTKEANESFIVEFLNWDWDGR